FQGQPVADLTPARSEGQLKRALDQLLAQLPVKPANGAAADIAPLVAMGEAVLAEGDAARAASIFAQIVDMAPASVEAASGLIRALLAEGKAHEAQERFDSLPEDVRSDTAMAPVRTALELAAHKVDDSELAALRAAAAADPANMAARLAFAEAAFAAGLRDEAADTLLDMIRREPAWNEGAAKARLLQMFEAIGLEDPWVASQRRRLSLLLFG
ncbi:MAG: tetratricopeptide repeat protein, partial [Alteraurantiacibacter sp.]|nr:tetratricopeptide repeat protein [Alteraurantiacibacter sp.]